MEVLPLDILDEKSFHRSFHLEALRSPDSVKSLHDALHDAIWAEPSATDYGSRSEWFEGSTDNVALVNPPTQTTDQYLHGWKLAIIMVSLCFGTFLIALDVAIVGVAIPRITTDFHSL